MATRPRPVNVWLAPVLWAALALGVVLNWHHLTALVRGPEPLTGDGLLALAESGAWRHRYVTVDAEGRRRLFERSYTLGKPPYSYFAALPVGDRWLILCVPDGAGPQLTGLLQPLAAFDRERVARRLTESDPARAVLPFRLNATIPYRQWTFACRLVPLLILAGAALTLTVRGWHSRRVRNSFTPLPSGARCRG